MLVEQENILLMVVMEVRAEEGDMQQQSGALVLKEVLGELEALPRGTLGVGVGVILLSEETQVRGMVAMVVLVQIIQLLVLL